MQQALQSSGMWIALSQRATAGLFRAPLGAASRLQLAMAPKRRSAAASSAAAKDAGETQQPEASSKRAKKANGKASAVVAAAAAGDDRAPGERRYFLMKSEPDVFSIDDLASKPDQTEHWDGVRSHQAKKVLQSMRLGDRALFYHSNAKPPGVVGIVEIVREAYPDHTQFDSKSEYYDASSTREAPKWFMVDCRLERKLRRQIPLEELKSHSGGALASMALFKYGRLSVQPVTESEWQFVLGLEGAAPAGEQLAEEQQRQQRQPKAAKGKKR